MSEFDRKPQIRFKGFTEPWEQRKFEDVAVRSSSMSTESGLPRVEYEDIISGTGRLNKDIFAKESEKAGIVFHKGDVLYGKLRPYLQNWLLPSFNGLAVGDFWVLQPQNADSSFLYRLIQIRQFDEVANQSTGTKMPRADWKLVSKTEFYIPHSIDEQSAIGTYFTNLDNLITLHQRKCDKLKTIKASLLKGMFPEKGANTPKIRFKGFTEPWEQRKFEDIFNFERPDAYIVKSEKYSDEYKTPVLTANKGFILGYTNETRTCNYPCIIFDDFTLDSKFVDFKFMVKSSAMKILSSKNGNDLYFDFERLNSSKLESLGHARHYISIVQPTITYIPKINEQMKIGSLFKNLDSLITLHQRKCEKLKNIKKSLLEQMFA